METGRVIGFDDVRRALAHGARVLLLVRHAERPHIDHDDPSFGASLELTENGRDMSRAFGRAFASVTDEVQFRASPLRRTVLTAELIAEGMGRALAGPVDEDDLIGNGSAFVADRLAVWRLFRDGRFFHHMGEYLRRGEQTGFAPLAPAAAAYETYVLSQFRATARLGIFTTHDIFLAAYLHAKGVKTDFDETNWPRFMDAAAVVLEPGGARRHAFLRSGLSMRAVGV